MEWSLFRTAIILSVVECCGQKRFRKTAGSEKRTPWWNQDVKEAIRAKKDAFNVLLQSRSSCDLQWWYSEEQKVAAQAVKMSKQCSWMEIGRRLDSNYLSENKLFWQTIRRLRRKSLGTTTSIKGSTGNIEKEILSR